MTLPTPEQGARPPARARGDASRRVPHRRRGRSGLCVLVRRLAPEPSELPELLGTKPVRSELVWQLVQLDKAFTASALAAWEDHHAADLVESFRG